MKIRNAAIAATAALALTFSGTAIAGAQETEQPEQVSLSSAIGTSLSSGNSSAIGDATDADERTNGEDILGEETNEDAPEWATKWANLANLAGLGVIVGGIIGAANFWQYITATGF
ncbi:hypothetical protein [Corynebacterium sp. A21]|uniref:hypothetical protein n=1 Tax=Corynebacterium sp. A21 TaxID=3457318 RepID=UPI003FD1D164